MFQLREQINESGYIKFIISGLLALIIAVSPVLEDEVQASSIQDDEEKVQKAHVSDAGSRETEVPKRLDISDYERELMAKAVYSEARGEPYEGQVAVAAVVINRVQDNRWPGNIEGVIFEPWAFTAVHDGQFWLTPNQTAYEAVSDALAGWDPTDGATFYYNPVTATSSWIFTRTPITTIGKHVFAI